MWHRPLCMARHRLREADRAGRRSPAAEPGVHLRPPRCGTGLPACHRGRRSARSRVFTVESLWWLCERCHRQYKASFDRAEMRLMDLPPVEEDGVMMQMF